MFVFKVLFLSLFAINSFECSKLPGEDPNNFGPYKVDFSNVKQCSGPKSKDLTKTTANMVKIGNSYILHMNVTFLEKIRMDHIRIEVYKINNNGRSILWNKRIDDPCKHYFLAEALGKYFGIGKNCIVPKGDKYFVSNLTDITYGLYGKSFYYGEYFMKGMSLSDKGNLFCMQLTSVYSKLG